MYQAVEEGRVSDRAHRASNPRAYGTLPQHDRYCGRWLVGSSIDMSPSVVGPYSQWTRP